MGSLSQHDKQDNCRVRTLELLLVGLGRNGVFGERVDLLLQSRRLRGQLRLAIGGLHGRSRRRRSQLLVLRLQAGQRRCPLGLLGFQSCNPCLQL